MATAENRSINCPDTSAKVTVIEAMKMKEVAKVSSDQPRSSTR
jgi:hypothetical protein